MTAHHVLLSGHSAGLVMTGAWFLYLLLSSGTAVFGLRTLIRYNKRRHVIGILKTYQWLTQDRKRRYRRNKPNILLEMDIPDSDNSVHHSTITVKANLREEPVPGQSIDLLIYDSQPDLTVLGDPAAKRARIRMGVLVLCAILLTIAMIVQNIIKAWAG